MCVREIRLLTWFPSHFHANFISAIAFKTGPWQGSNTCSQPPRCAGSAKYRCIARRGRYVKWEGGSGWEEQRRENWCPPAAPAPHSETCHSRRDSSFSVHAWGINLYQKRLCWSHQNNGRCVDFKIQRVYCHVHSEKSRLPGAMKLFLFCPH